MLSPEIDLTANGDFGLGVGFLMDTRIEIPLDEYAVMSNEEYEALLWWEGIFGRRGHRSDKLKVFERSPVGLSKNGTQRCRVCGKEMRLPWKRRYDNICIDCYNNSRRDLSRIPWKPRFHQSTDDRGWNLFARR